MLKVLYLPIGSQPGTEQGFRNVGTDLRVYDFFSDSQNGRSRADICATFLSHVQDHKPDLIHMQLQLTDVIDIDTIQKARRIVPNAVFTNWTGDIRTKPAQAYINMSKVVDFSLMSHVGQINMYKAAGCHNPAYWQIGCDPDRYYPQNLQSFKYDVVFAGNAYPASTFPDCRLRLDICRKLKETFGERFGLFGSGYPKNLSTGAVDIGQMNNMYAQSACVLSVSHFNDVSHYFSDRLLMCLASARPTIIYRFPGYSSYFAKDRDVLVANSVQEVADLVKKCTNDPNFANYVGKNGFQKVYTEHSFTSRILELISMTNLTHKL